MHLEELLAGHQVELEGRLDRDIDRIVCDSREAGPSTLFAAIRGGQEADRHDFVADAIQRGAAAVVVEDALDCGPATRILVEDARRLLPHLASRLQGEPARHLRCVGVTGTNGKTTTAWLLHNILQQASGDSAYLGTLGFQAGSLEMQVVPNTTPEAPALHALLQQAKSVQ